MTEISRAEMQAEHYKSLKSPMYVLDGMFDVLREELSMQQPSLISGREIQIVYKEDIEWTPRQWDIVNQLRGEMRHLSSKVNEMRATVTKKHKHKLSLNNKGGGEGRGNTIVNNL